MHTIMDDYYNGEPDEVLAPDPWDLIETDTYETDIRHERARSLRRTTNHLYWHRGA